jgi:hypothetical protein
MQRAVVQSHKAKKKKASHKAAKPQGHKDYHEQTSFLRKQESRGMTASLRILSLRGA